jgi:drug/metabolite transporter (DMT)-like permease
VRPAARTTITTALALLCFALNSLLCRLALKPGAIDAASFSTLRVAAGAAMLGILWASRGRGPRAPAGGRWLPAALLFLYAVPFSFAYLGLDVGPGALLLFGAVQATMITAGLVRGERPRLVEWIGLALALAGLAYLAWPGLAAPPLWSSLWMAGAGVAWGFYSLRGRGAVDPLRDTARNFLLALPLTAGVSLVTWRSAHLSGRGILLAIASGAVASGLGYVAWYAALRRLTATRAAAVQLAVPALAAGLGVVALGESLTPRLLLAATLILGGVALTLSPLTLRRRDSK